MTYDPLLENIKNYIRENLSYRLSIADIAGQVGFNNVTYFDRQFYKKVGMSPRSYCNAVKDKKT